ncbi:Crp/Fnr family transcriptional regulator [Dongia deserti]|uniref:Crp/Fnr family transcriptional regulator n=1 Tax=Dongia deserti TaxID=2268030 RepID=UPI0013C41105|nr:Crp/Fnr family transcriptional regulator [Dongia deserti]
MTDEDVIVVDRLLSTTQVAPAGATLIPEGHVGGEAYVLLAGWAYRFRMFEDGRRQISRLLLPGDFIGLNASYLGMPEQSIVALTDVQLAKIDAKLLMEHFRQSPRLSLAFLWSDTRDRFITEERVASIGRRSAYERLAHVFLELYLRLELIGEAAEDVYSLPLTQEHLADLLGLTSIHVNRVLHRLKNDGLIAMEARTIRLLSREKLMRVSDFDPRYLMHRSPK